MPPRILECRLMLEWPVSVSLASIFISTACQDAVYPVRVFRAMTVARFVHPAPPKQIHGYYRRESRRNVRRIRLSTSIEFIFNRTNNFTAIVFVTI